MKYQLKVDDIPIQKLHNFCILHDLSLDVDNMTIDLAEVKFKT